MKSAEPILDPLGNWIQFSASFFNQRKPRLFDELKPVIARPSFVISVKGEGLYFFRLINPDVNVLIETRANNGDYIAVDYVENPSVSYISSLLQKGSLLSFSTP